MKSNRMTILALVTTFLAHGTFAQDTETRRAIVLRDRAITLHKSGKLDEALQTFDESLQAAPTALAYLGRAQIFHSREKLPAAIADCDRALQLNPQLAVAYTLRAFCRFAQDDINRALADFTVAIDIDAAHENAFVGRATVWFTLQRHELAVPDWTQAIRLDPNNVEAYVGRAVCWQELQQPQKAVDDWSRVIKLSPRDVLSYLGRAMVYKSQGNYQAAKSDFERALGEDDRNVDARHSFAFFLATCPDKDLRDYKLAIDLAHGACHETNYMQYELVALLATTYAQSGDFELASRWQSTAIGLAPESAHKKLKDRLELYRQKKMPFPVED